MITTSDTDGLREVIAKLEAATCGSKSLDRDIWVAIGLTPEEEAHCRDWCRMGGRTDLTRDRYISAWAKDYTTSLDAALTLVPDGFVVSLTIGPGPIRYAAVGMYETRGATPALALCIAALKARAAQSHQPERGEMR